MANNAFHYGFRWHSNRNGGDTKPQPERVRVATSYAAAPGGVQCDLQPGDVVKKVSDGTVELAVAGDAFFGVIDYIGWYYDAGVGAMVKNSRLPYAQGAYGTNYERETEIYIIPAAGQIFRAMADDASTATTYAGYRAFIGENADMINDAVAPNVRPLLDISTHATTTAQWRIVDIGREVNIDFTGLYVPILVTGLEIQQAPWATTGV